MEPSAVAQRELLLNVLLHYNMVGVIVATVRDWADGKYSKVNSYFYGYILTIYIFAQFWCLFGFGIYIPWYLVHFF